MKKIITISREFGAGGGEIGDKLARKLNYEYYNKELILQTAAQSNVDMQSLIKWDEKVPLQFGFAQSLFDFYNRPMSEKIFQAQSEVIRQIGEKGDCVIVGRNSNSILKEFDHSLHVFIHAGVNWRLERMRPRMSDMTDDKIMEEIKMIDKVRSEYCSYHTGTNIYQVQHFDLTLNSEKLGIDHCVDLVYQAAQMI